MTREETLYRYEHCNTRLRLICGGLRSGKSHLAAETVAGMLDRRPYAGPVTIAVVNYDDAASAYCYRAHLHRLFNLGVAAVQNTEWRSHAARCPDYVEFVDGSEVHFFTSTETWPFDVDAVWIDNDVKYPHLVREWLSTRKHDGLFIWSQWDWTESREAKELWLANPESQFVLSTLDNPGLHPDRIADLIAAWNDTPERLTGKVPCPTQLPGSLPTATSSMPTAT